MFANAPGDLGSIPDRVIPKTQKMVLDASLLNTQHYKVSIKGKVEQSRERSSAPLHLGVVSYRKGSLRVILDYGRQLYFTLLYGLEGRVFANYPGDLGSIPGRIIPKTLKIVLDTSLLNTQKYKVGIEGKVEQSRERSSTLPDTLM